MEAELREKLREYWGFDEFRPLQCEAMLATMDRRDCLCVLPTGAGKSLLYQLPALLTGSGSQVTLVVSPLIALAEEQVQSLLARGVAAASARCS